MRIATFNVENLFSRPAAMNLETWTEGREVLEDVARLNGLISRPRYTDAIKQKIFDLLKKYRFDNRNIKSRPFDIVQVREKLFTVYQNEIRIKADGRADWVGWVSLTREQIDSEAVMNTARVIATIAPDIVALIEVEDRISLGRFNKQMIAQFPSGSFAHNMLIDGNDARGIDIGLLSRFPINFLRSHIDRGGAQPVFSRDCPEYEVLLPNGKSLWVLANHFKSKGYGNAADNDAKRRAQAEAVADIYRAARTRSDFVAVVGDLNDTPESATLAPLLQATDLRDVMTHASYDGPPGTFRTSKQKIDYLLLSPALWARVQVAGVERGGIYAPRAGAPYDSVTALTNQASDHAAVWAELALL